MLTGYALKSEYPHMHTRTSIRAIQSTLSCSKFSFFAGETHTELTLERVCLKYELCIRSVWRNRGEAHDHQHNGQGEGTQSINGKQPTDHIAHVPFAHEQIPDVLWEQQCQWKRSWQEQQWQQSFQWSPYDAGEQRGRLYLHCTWSLFTWQLCGACILSASPESSVSTELI